jgi:hypothetical protein
MEQDMTFKRMAVVVVEGEQPAEEFEQHSTYRHGDLSVEVLVSSASSNSDEEGYILRCLRTSLLDALTPTSGLFYPAEVHPDINILVINGHGQGVMHSLCTITNTIASQAPFDLIIGDACGLLSIEVLLSLEPYGDQFIASAQDVPVVGLPYRSLAELLHGRVRKGMLIHEVLRRFRNHQEELSKVYPSSVHWTAVDLRGTQALAYLLRVSLRLPGVSERLMRVLHDLPEDCRSVNILDSMHRALVCGPSRQGRSLAKALEQAPRHLSVESSLNGELTTLLIGREQLARLVKGAGDDHEK